MGHGSVAGRVDGSQNVTIVSSAQSSKRNVIKPDGKQC